MRLCRVMRISLSVAAVVSFLWLAAAAEDTRLAPEHLSLNETVEGILSSGGPDVWYKVHVPSPGALSVAVTGSGSLRVQVRMYQAGTLVSSDVAGVTAERTAARPDLDAGPVSVRVTRTSGSGVFSIRADHLPARDHPGELQRSAADEPVILPLPGQVQGQLGFLTAGRFIDDQWYRLEVSEPGQIRVEVQSDEELTMQARIYEEADLSLLQWDSTGPHSTAVLEQTAAADTYLLRISRGSGFGSFVVRSSAEPLGRSTAPQWEPDQQESTPLSSAEFWTGHFDSADSEQRPVRRVLPIIVDQHAQYGFSVSADESLSVGARLYHGNKFTVLRRDEDGLSSERSLGLSDLAPGTYYLVLEQQSGAGSLRVTPQLGAAAAQPGPPQETPAPAQRAESPEAMETEAEVEEEEGGTYGVEDSTALTLSEPLLLPPEESESLEQRMQSIQEAFADSPMAQEEVVRTMFLQGEGALPNLLAYLQSDDERMRRAAASALADLESPDPDAAAALVTYAATREQNELVPARTVLRTLNEQGVKPGPACVEHLVDLLVIGDSRYGEDVQELLVRAGGAAVAPLADLLSHSDTGVVTRAAMALGAMGTDAAGAASNLLEASHVQTGEPLRRCLEALYLAAPGDPAYLAAFAAALEDADSRIVAAGARGLARMEEPQSEYLDAISAAIPAYADDVTVRWGLAQAAGLYGEAVVNSAQDWLGSEGELVIAGANVMRWLGEAGETLVPTALQAYEEADVSGRVAILQALPQYGSPEIESLLLEAANDDNSRVARAAVRGMGSFPNPPDAFAELLWDAALDESNRVASDAVEALAQLGPNVVQQAAERIRQGDERGQTVGAIVMAEAGPVDIDSLETLYETVEQQIESGDDMDEILWRMWSMDAFDAGQYGTLEDQPAEFASLVADLVENDWMTAVVAVKELVEMMMGPMDEDEMAQLDAEWMPMTAYPSMELREYLLELAAALEKFLRLRAAVVESGHQYENLLAEAWTALGYQEPEALERTLLLARHSAQALVGLQQRLAAQGEAVMAMLPPPDAQELQALARSRHEEALQAVVGWDWPTETRPGQYWVLTETSVTSEDGYIDTLGSMVSDEGDRTIVRREGFQAGSEMFLSEGDTRTVSGYVRWTPLPHVVQRDGDSFRFPWQVEIDLDHAGWRDDNLTGQAAVSIRSSAHGPTGQGSYGRGREFDNEQGPLVYDGVHRISLGTVPYSRERVSELQITVQAVTPGGSTSYGYTYELMELESHEVYDLQQLDRAKALARLGMEDKLWEDYVAGYQEAASRIDAIALHRQQAAWFSAEAETLQEELRQTTDADALGQLAWQLLVAEANAQAELDQAHYAQTGEWQRTPTSYDHFVRVRLAEQSQQMARDVDYQQRVAAGIPRLIALAPQSMQQDLNAFVDRNLQFGDIDQVRAVVDAVGTQVEGYWRRDAADADYAAAVADERLYWSQTVRSTAGMALVGAAAPAALTAGLSAHTVSWAPTAVRLAYGGTTGYLDGGLAESVRQTVAWSHSVGSVAVAAYDGFYQAGPDGEAGGWTGAGLSAAQAYAYSKVFEYGIRQSNRLLSTQWPSLKRPLFGLGVRPNVQPTLAGQEYNKGMEQGRSLVSQWQDTQFQLEASRASGMGITTETSTTAALRQKAGALAAQINSSYEAKWFLKHMTPPHVQTMFDRQLNTLVYDRVMPAYLRNLETMGYDIDNLAFETKRNASSAGSVGMDYDLALEEAPGKPAAIFKNGQRVSHHVFIRDANQAYGDAYVNVTGFRAASADVHVTTLLHPEAFRDQALLSNNPNVSQISSANVQQAGDVFRYKVQMSLDSHAHNEVLQFQAVSRDLEKELRTKVMPFIDTRLQQASLQGNSQGVRQLQAVKAHWSNIYQRLDAAGRHETDPTQLRRIQQELGMLTGQNMQEMVDKMVFTFEGLGKFW